MEPDDIISSVQFDYDVQAFISPDLKKLNLSVIKNNVNFCKYSNNLDANLKSNLFLAMDYGLDTISDIEIENENNFQSNDKFKSLDKYIYLFIYASDFKFENDKESHSILSKLLSNDVSLILFVFDDVLKEDKLKKIKGYLKLIMEGYVVHVKNFQIIEETFQNNAKKPKKNILGCNFDNFRYIF